MIRIVVVFPGAVAADEAEQLSGANVEGEVLERDDVAVSLRDPVDLEQPSIVDHLVTLQEPRLPALGEPVGSPHARQVPDDTSWSLGPTRLAPAGGSRPRTAFARRVYQRDPAPRPPARASG